MAEKDINTIVLKDLNQIFPQLPTPLLLQVIIDTVNTNGAFYKKEINASFLVQSCVDQLLDIGCTSDDHSPLKSLLSPTNSPGPAFVPVKDSPPYEIVSRDIPGMKSTAEDSASLHQCSSSSATSSSFSDIDDNIHNYDDMVQLLKKSSTSAKIRRLFSNFKIRRNSDCCENQCQAEISKEININNKDICKETEPQHDDRDRSDWYMVPNNLDSKEFTNDNVQKNAEFTLVSHNDTPVLSKTHPNVEDTNQSISVALQKPENQQMSTKSVFDVFYKPPPVIQTSQKPQTSTDKWDQNKFILNSIFCNNSELSSTFPDPHQNSFVELNSLSKNDDSITSDMLFESGSLINSTGLSQPSSSERVQPSSSKSAQPSSSESVQSSSSQGVQPSSSSFSPSKYLIQAASSQLKLNAALIAARAPERPKDKPNVLDVGDEDTLNLFKEDVDICDVLLAKKSNESDMETNVRKVLDIFPTADFDSVKVLLEDSKFLDPANFVYNVISMMSEHSFEENYNMQELIRKVKHKAQRVELQVIGKTTNNTPSSSSSSSSKSSVMTANTIPTDIIKRKRKASLENDSYVCPSPQKNLKVEEESMKLSDNGNTIVPTSTEVSGILEGFMINCEGCDNFLSTDKLCQCCEGHLLCEKCLEVEVKQFLKNGSSKVQICCKVKNCSSSVSLGEVSKVMSCIIVELINEKLEEKSLTMINKLQNIVQCPECGFSAEVDQNFKEIHCANKDCMLAFCRYCKKSWNDSQHDTCSSLLLFIDTTGSDKILQSYPRFWTHVDMDTNKDFISFEVDPNSEEFGAVACQFYRTVQKQIKTIVRIQNIKLWQKYALTRKHILDEIGQQKINEQHLFHGTDQKNIELICKDGFDWRLCGKHGVALGNGTYFAKNAQYSDIQFVRSTSPSGTLFQLWQHGQHISIPVTQPLLPGTQPSTTFNQFQIKQVPTFPFTPNFPPNLTNNQYRESKFMLVARVTCGKHALGNSQLKRPPVDQTDPKKRLFNSVTDNLNNPLMYCIFESSQAYPEYIIEYANTNTIFRQ